MESSNRGEAVDRDPAGRFGGRAFGIELAGSFRVPGVLEPEGPEPAADAPGRRIEIELSDVSAVDSGWPAKDAERTFELNEIDGSPLFTIDRDGRAGYRIWIAGLGVCVVSPAGDRIVHAPADAGPKRWRLLVGQGLPIAAALQGLEVLHASAVVHNGRALAFVAASGTGKTVLALHLLAHGARFLADDVVALEARDESLLAHPGIPGAHVPGSAQDALSHAGIMPGRTLDATAKHHIELDLPREPAPLARLYFLERAEAVGRLSIEALDPPDPRLLLASTFVSHVPNAERLITQLDVCSRIARTVPLFHVRMPLEGDPAEAAALVAEHAAT